MATTQEEKTRVSIEEDIQDIKDNQHEAATSNAFVEDTPEEKKLLWKIDLWLMPTIWVLYLFSYMDRTNIGNARVAGMGAYLKLTDNEYFLCVVLFQIGYVVAEIPSNMIMSRWRPSRYIPLLMFLWGTVAACLAAVKTTQQLLALRFLLGVMEAGFSPAILFLISSWYRRHEQSKRFIIFLSAGIISGAFGGIVAGAITARIDGAHGIAGWRWLFLVEGIATIGASLLAPFFLLDYPGTSKKLTVAERQLATARLQADGMSVREEGADHATTHIKALRIALLNWRVWILAVAYMTIIGSLSLSYFYPTLVKGLGYTAVNAQFMTAPLYIVAVVIALPVCFFADRKGEYRGVFVCVVMICGAIFCALATGIQSYVPRYIFLCFINSAIWTANPLALSFASVSLGPVNPESRAISLAIINGCGNLAQIYGAAIFPTKDAPKYLTGFGVYSGLLFLGGMMYLGAWMLFRKYPFKPSY